MKSRLISVLTLAILLPLAGVAQLRDLKCDILPYSVFKGVSKKKPVELKVLGTSPQFGEVPEHTGASAYNHLRTVYSSNIKKSAKEIDKLFSALGYKGFNDPSITEKTFIPEIIPAGTVGWMGAYASGHKYAWSKLGNNFETFKIYAKGSQCFIYIMKKCGNAFYVPSSLPVPPNLYRPPVVAPPAPIMTCKTQNITISGSGEISSGDVVSMSKTMDIIAVNTNAKPSKGILLGSYLVGVRSTYDFNVKGEVQYAKNVEVCMEGNASPAPMNLTLPMNLNYKITRNDVSIGDGEKLYLNVTEAQYKALSKAYKEVDVTSTAAANLVVAPKQVNVTNSSETMSAGSSSSETKCADQKINFLGKTEIKDGSLKSSTNDVTIIGVYKKTGKLANGETADKYLCLGSFQVPVKSAYEFTTSGGSDVSKIFRVCTKDGVSPADQNINVPVKMTYNFTKQDVMIGDYNKLYVNLTEKQYKSLSKKYNRCCTEGGEGKCD
ncbi:hypothetical protein Emtol_4236 [Emticicia oligotrophica DSM 17448]|uniref:Uncharacterized protein n=1 Tax=Emticicia oligotrophica (strain DSM 17448 / CIP 109782 / MTCC 6937 / GPTSA100-15) TaxID=929562 RepID=A0ABN4AT56_EMTOG|nr:hypothetical protein [Emticicia oligotrophica]AFK05360.1 hypothetical protein Emtol_4236 [Emticicia oligotrophica DSM 17448]